nr:hypothetical protein BaRGS_008763 [Batillaria attramentaria]
MDLLDAFRISSARPSLSLNGTANSTYPDCNLFNDLLDGNASTTARNRSTAFQDNFTAEEDHHGFIPWDNPNNVISRDTLHLIEMIVTCGFNPVLLIIGVPANILNCIVFHRQGLKDRMNLCLFSLALVDMANIILCFLTGSSNLLENLSPQVRFWWKWTIRKYCRGLHAAFLFASGCLTMVVAVERCIVVTWPIKAAHLMTTRTMAIIVVSVVVFLNLLSLVYLSHYNVVEATDVLTGESIYALIPTKFYLENKAFVDFMHSTIITIAVPFTTFVVVGVATGLTVINLKRAIAWRESSAANSATMKSQITLAKMLVIISVIYIVAASPHIALGFARYLVPEFSLHGRYANIFVAAHVIPLTLSAFNSSVNLFVYVIRSSRFRKELAGVLPACARKAERRVEQSSGSHAGADTKISVVPNANI